MKPYQKSILMLCLFLVVLPSCSKHSQSTSEKIKENFQTIVPITDMNKSLQVEVYGGEKNFQSDSAIHLRLHNKSPHSIFFPLDSHIKLLMLSDAKWVQVKNEMTYSGLLQLAPQDTPLLDSNTTWVKPIPGEKIIRNAKENILLRIVMIGEIMENDIHTGTLVGAYVDVYITP